MPEPIPSCGWLPPIHPGQDPTPLSIYLRDATLGWEGEVSSPPMASWLLPVLLTSGITLLTAALGVIWVEIKSSEARTGKRLDDLRADMKASEARQREDMAQFKADVQASEARQREDMAQFKADVQASEARQREDMAQFKADVQASEARQREDMAQLKADNRALNEKLDRLVESLRPARPS